MPNPTPLFPIIVSKLFGNGSPSPSSDDLFIVTVDTSSTPYTADKTYAEVSAAISAGKMVVYIGPGFQAATIQPGSGVIYAYGIIRSGVNPLLVTLQHTAVSLTISTVGLEAAPTVVSVSGSTPTLDIAENNCIYNCGELTSLTITAFDNPGKFWIWFTSGATPTTVTGIDNFTPEANKKYRVFVENGYATADEWSVGGA